MTMMHAAPLVLAALGTVLLGTPSAPAQTVSYKALVAPVLSETHTVIGEALAYPLSTPAKVTALIVTVPPGGETGWHRHPVPLFGYILEGTLTVDYGPHGTRIYETGDGLIEAMSTAHNGRNLGFGPVRILAVYMGAEGLANAEAAQAPPDMEH
jgi:quercetin dioxygenase-like cupin family protein